MEASWERLGGILERLGASWSRLGGVLETSWSVLERLGAVLELRLLAHATVLELVFLLPLLIHNPYYIISFSLLFFSFHLLFSP